MFDYTGYDCRSCGKQFTAEDDIVVCPDCGTPYHRECYKNEGKCVNTELHESHVSWKTDIEQKEQQESTSRCRGCQNKLRDDQLFCDKCGMPTEYFVKSGAVRPESAQNDANAEYRNIYSKPADGSEGMTEVFFPFMINYSDPLCGFNPEEEYDGGVTTRDLGDFVGKNTHYYLPKFKLMKTGHFKISMNIPALFFPEFYFAYRKMPLAALLIMLIKTAVDLPASVMSLQIMFDNPQMLAMFRQSFPELIDSVNRLMEINLNTEAFNFMLNTSNLLSWVSIFVFGSLSNYMYYRFALKKASKVKNSAISNELNISESLRSSGGTSASMLALFIGVYCVVSMIATIAILMLV